MRAARIFFVAFVLSCISFSGFAQVTVSPANDTLICSRTAANGSTPAFTTLGNIVISETVTNGFIAGSNQIIINAPTGWQFGPTSPTATWTGSDILGVTITGYTPTSFVLNINTTGTSSLDVVNVVGLQVQATTMLSATGHIYASFVSGISGGILVGSGPGGTNFGILGLIPAPITGPTHVCLGSCITLTSSPGVTWSSTNTSIASVNPATGLVCGVSAGNVVIRATLSGCTDSIRITVDPPAPALLGIHNMCAWFDSLTVTVAPGADHGGLYSASLVTVINTSPVPGSGSGTVYAHAPGTSASITYTLPTGCATTVIFTVNPLPTPILAPPYAVCAGSSISLTSSPVGGTWSVSNTHAGVGSGTGVVTGLTAGIDTVFYTLPTGCKTDTAVTVYPLPAPIGGDSTVCELSTMTVTDVTGAGTWSSSTGSIATVNPSTGVVTAVSAGIDTIFYTLPTGCFVYRLITVNPLPAAIVGPSAVCVNDSILLTDGTAGGTWTSSFPAIASVDPSTGYVLGVSGGVTTIFYTLPTTCRMVHNVTVNTLPTPIFGGPNPICAGLAGVDSNLTPGGTWSSAPITTAVPIDPTSGVFTTSTPGIARICYTLTSTGCSICDTITVSPVPLPITGPDSICVGSWSTLYDATPGGIWHSADPSRLSIDSVAGTDTGIIANPLPVQVTYKLGGCSSAPFDVTVFPVPGPVSGGPVCQSDSVQLIDILPGGVWTSANPSFATIDPVTGWVHGIMAGTVNITYTANGGCSVVYPLVVNINLPIIGPNHVCQGDPIVLTNSNPGGTWVSSNTSVATIVGGVYPDTTAVLTGVTPGVTTITYTTPDGCVSTLIVTVDPMQPIVGPTFICVGSTTTYTDAVPGGMWISSNTAIGSIDAIGNLTGTGPGVVTITYSVTATGCSATTVVTVNPLPTPITAADSAVCVGDTLVLSSTPGAGTYTSSNNAIATVNITTGTVTGISAGVATMTYSLGTGCYVTFTLTVNPISPISGPDSVCVGSSILLIDTTSGGVWDMITPYHGFASVNPGGVVTGLEPGVDTVTYTMPVTGCRAVYSVRVDELPGAIIGPDSVCTGTLTIYTDTPALGTWSVSTPVVATINPATGLLAALSPGADTITYTLSTGCSISRVVTVNLTPSPIAGPNHVCLARRVTLSDPTPGGVWTNTYPAITIGTAGVVDTVTGVGLGIDTIYYTLPAGGCSARLSFTVTPIPTITVSPNPTPIKCKYASVTITASGAGAGGTYSWTPSYGLSCTNCASPSATPTITTTYTVTGTTAFGCDSFTTVTVVVDDSLNHMKIVGKDSICNGTCDTLKASGRAGSYFAWHPIGGLSCTICDTVVACPTATTTYWAVAIDDLGCKDSVSFTVNVNPLPLINVNPNPTIVCKGKPLTVHATSPNTDDATNTYTWAPNLFISCDTCANPVLTDTANLVYRLRCTTIYGCYDSFDVKVSVLDTNVNWIVPDTNICIGGSALLMATSHSVISNLDIPTFTWLPNYFLSDPFNKTTYANPPVTTTYSVAIHENVCFDDTLSVTVFVQPYPSITITTSATTPPNIVAGTPIQLTAIVTNTPVGSYAWTPANTLTCDSCYNPVAIPTVNTTYTVTVTSIYGCTSYDSVTLDLYCDNSQIFIPNTFTPNGDGINDRFYVSGKGISEVTLMQIVNRWGQVVYEAHNIKANDPSTGWDGTFKGKVLEPDVFVYVVKAVCELGTNTYTYTGDISIVK